MVRNPLIALMVLLASLSWAEDYTDLGKSFAEGIKPSKSNLSTDNALNYEGTDVPGTEFADDNSLSNMEDAARIETATGETGQFIEETVNVREQYIFNTENDPLFKRFDEINEQANSLTDSYSGCVQLPVGTDDVTDAIPESCLRIGSHDVIEYTCERKLSVSCSNVKAGAPLVLTASDFTVTGDAGVSVIKQAGDNFIFGTTGGTNRHGDCKWFYNQIKFYVKDKEQVHSIKIKGGVYDDWLYIRFNWNYVFRGIGRTYNDDIVNPSYKCEQKGDPLPADKVSDLLPLVRNGWNYFNLSNLVGGGGKVRIEIEIILLEPCGEIFGDSTTCPPGENTNDGVLVSNYCTDAYSTKYIGVFPFYKTCWSWDKVYTRNSDPVYVDDQKCEDLRNNGCTSSSSTCIEFDPLGYCKKREYDFTCYDTHAAQYVTMCGDTLICAEGECGSEYQESADSTSDMAKAVSTFEAANAVGDSYGDDLTIFTGQNYKCDKDRMYSTKDCCKDNGWANGLFANCSSAEKTLGFAREDERAFETHYWTWKKKTLGVTVESWSYRSFCVFPTKLSRIIMKQAYEQLGIVVMGEKSPNCRGLTEIELGQLDWDAIDLQEFTDDVMEASDGAGAPSVEALKERLQTQMEAM
jgi:conjugal transfer mating pair stabilization protein TraN